MIFFLSSLDYCANCQADSYPCSPNWLPTSVNYLHLPLKFNCPILPDPTSSFPPRNLTQLFAYLERLLQISSFCQPSLELSALHRGRESGTLYWKQWEELKITRCLFSILTNWWLLIKTIFSGVGGTFYFVLDGEVWVLPLSSGDFWSQEGWKHWHIPPGKGPQVSEVLPNLRVRTLVPLVRGRDHKGPTDSISLLASGQPWGAVLTKAVLNPPLLPCDKPANLTWLFCKMLCKKENAMEPLGWEETERLSIEKMNL